MVEQSAPHVVSPDTQATLLLCGRFGRSETNGCEPLKPGEFDKLAQWLQNHALRPRDLLDRDGQAILDRDDLPVPAPRLRMLLERGAALALAIECWTNNGLWIVSRGDAVFPRRLIERLSRSIPPMLYGVGDIGLLSAGGLAIVGSRDVDQEALDFARRVAEIAAGQGITVVSGGARGIDGEAMGAALEAGGRVVGVLADSLARAAVARKYREALLDGRLVLVSTYDPGSGFSIGQAMGRNKYIYALADWGLVVSTSFESGGTWAGAKEALEQHRRPVYVRIQGNVPDGNWKLLELGARPFPNEPWPGLVETLAGRHSRPQTAYDLVLPLLLAHLNEPQDRHALADLLDVQQNQALTWLKRAMKEGKVESVKSSKPTHYIVTRQQPLPFLDGPDAH